jgi:hypothetical protein
MILLDADLAALYLTTAALAGRIGGQGADQLLRYRKLLLVAMIGRLLLLFRRPGVPGASIEDFSSRSHPMRLGEYKGTLR